ncbi:MAG: flavin-nucleotide-binding protein [Methanomicrobiales archaeon]|nr:flavin-nucleotide-binding protein [Methanomicrobiales archaeon]
MVTLTNEIKESIAAAKTAFLATSAQDGTPNVVPIGAFKVLDDSTLLISDQYFNKTAKNLAGNKKVALSWWGDKAGFQIKGTVTIYTDGEIFTQDVAWVKGIKASLNPKAALVLKITDVYSIRPGPDAGKKIL